MWCFCMEGCNRQKTNKKCFDRKFGSLPITIQIKIKASKSTAYAEIFCCFELLNTGFQHFFSSAEIRKENHASNGSRAQ